MPACQRIPCQNNGKCTEVDGNVLDYECNCTADYEGRNCEVHKACKSENCNGGECIPKESNPNDFICLCPLGRVGVQCQTGKGVPLPHRSSYGSMIVQWKFSEFCQKRMI